jgi:hypothetical protein
MSVTDLEEFKAGIDRARRASEAVNLHVLAGAAGRWMAIRLSDGGSDGHTYDNKAEAVRFQIHEKQCAYIRIPPDGMTPKQAKTSVLDFQEGLYNVGARLADPATQLQQPINFR